MNELYSTIPHDPRFLYLRVHDSSPQVGNMRGCHCCIHAHNHMYHVATVRTTVMTAIIWKASLGIYPPRCAAQNQMITTAHAPMNKPVASLTGFGAVDIVCVCIYAYALAIDSAMYSFAF
jgi:hypothetical protein